jgi:hypothetical protein
MSAIGEYGAWRVKKSLANDQGKTIEVTKKKKTVKMSYTFGAETEIKTLDIGMEDTVRSVLGKRQIEEHVVVNTSARTVLNFCVRRCRHPQ